MSRSLLRRAVLAALPAALVAVALPAAAHASNVSLNNGFMSYNHSGGSTSVISSVVGGDVRLRSSTGIQEIVNSACRRVDAFTVSCPGGSVQRLTVTLGSGSDVFTSNTALDTLVFGLGGEDVYVGGGHPLRNRVDFNGGLGHDQALYAASNSGVNVNKDELANDGRRTSAGSAFDFDNIRADVEQLVGSSFDDVLFGGTGNDLLNGRAGNDTLAGGGGDDRFIASPGDGADDYHGGPSRDTIDYGAHTRPVLIDLDNVSDDGELGENDNVRSNVENVNGGSGNDSIKSLGAHSVLDGRGGNDHLVGAFGPDTVIGGPGADRLEGGTEDDVIDARDGEQDTVICGSGVDAVTADLSTPADLMTGCENVPVGKLRLAPKAIAATSGKPAHVRLSWRHPRAWRKLRSIELRLYRDGAPVGEVTIRARADRITADGAVALVRKHTRLTHKGKTVTARLAVRLDEGLAGQTLTAEVEATDMRGARQLERDAGTVRVAG